MKTKTKANITLGSYIPVAFTAMLLLTIGFCKLCIAIKDWDWYSLMITMLVALAIVIAALIYSMILVPIKIHEHYEYKIKCNKV